MSDSSRIQWTDATWNPVTGCSPVSPGCANCYAARFAGRLQAMGSPKYVDGFKPRVHPESLEEPDKWRRPRRVFVCSMGDLFHPAIRSAFIRDVFATMERNERHVFQVLTKRAGRLGALAGYLRWPPNVWIGVSVENDDRVSRLLGLREVPAAVRFVSLEPLLEPVPSLLTGIVDLEDDPLGLLDWIIVGGETGPGARIMPTGWPQRIRDAAVRRGLPFFFKSWGSAGYGRRSPVLEGRLWNEFPSTTGRGGERGE